MNNSVNDITSLKITAAVFALTVIIAMTFYLATLAPGVTFEDSGELISAAFHLGVPHQPGYPLFTLLGRLFCHIPVGSIAFRMNLMSAVMTALACGFIAISALLILQKTTKSVAKKPAQVIDNKWLTGSCSVAAGILAAAAYESWEQAIITEVYGLNSLFVGVFIYLSLRWYFAEDASLREKLLLLLAFVAGLSLTNHTTSLMFVPVFLLFWFVSARREMLNLKRLGWLTLFFGGAFAVYLYLPLASARDPQMDWGNPETAVNFFRTIIRHQYLLDEPQSMARFLPQLAHYGDLLWQQWIPAFLILAVAGLLLLFKQQRQVFYFVLAFLIFAGPVTTYLTNFEVNRGSAFVIAEHKALVSVFYIPSYLLMALLMGCGGFWLLSLLPERLLQGHRIAIIAAPFVLLPLLHFPWHRTHLDMSDYHYAEDYVHNLFSVADSGDVIFADWDPFYFPTNYAQFVENRRRDVLVLDQQLLRRSWYIQWLKDHYPTVMPQVELPTQEFLDAVAPFEAGKPFQAAFIQQRYVGMINAIIEHTRNDGREVLFTYQPREGIAAGYPMEPLGPAWKLRDGRDSTLTEVSLDGLKFRGYESGPPAERLAAHFRDYYAAQMLNRGKVLETFGRIEEAKKWYAQTAILATGNRAVENALNAIRQRLHFP